MGIIRNGLLNHYKKSVGNITGTWWKGIRVIRIKPGKRVKKRGAKPLAQNLRFGLMSEFLSHCKTPVQNGFHNKKDKKSQSNMAMKYNIINAITGEYPNFEINYPKVVLSAGKGETAWSATAFFESDFKVRVTWEISELSDLKVIGKDKAHILFYNSTKQRAMYMDGRIERKELTFTTQAMKPFQGDTIHVWMFFVSPDGKTISNSDYIGSGIIIA